MGAMGSSVTPVQVDPSRSRPSDEIEYRLSAILGYASMVACGAGLIKLLF